MKFNKKLVYLFILFFLQGIVTNIHHPLTPFYVRSLELSDYMIGLYFSVMNIGILLGGPFWGNLGDQGKQKNVIFTGLVLYGVGQSLFGFGHIFNEWTLAVFRLISGFGISAATTVIMSEIILVSKRESRAKSISYAVAILALGGSLGYFIGGQIHTNELFINIFKTNEFKNALLFQGISIFIVAILFYFTYKPVSVERKVNSERTYFWEGFKEIKNIQKSLMFFLIALTLITLSQTNVDKYLEIYIADIGYKADTLGNFKMVVGIITIIITLTIVPLIMKFKRKILLSTILQVISAITILIVFRVNDNIFISIVYSVFMFYIISKAIFAPLEQNHISTYSNDENVGKVMGIRQSFFSLGTIIGPLFGGLIYSISPNLLFDISAYLFLLSIVFLYLSYIYTKKELINQ